MTLGTPGEVLAHHAAVQAEAAAKVAGPAQEDTRTHETEIMASHGGQPSVAEQSASHGAPLPAADHGTPDREKYS